MQRRTPQSNLDRLYLPYLDILCGTSEGQSDPTLPGIYREVNPKLGTGYYWYYPIDDIMAVNIAEMELSIEITASCAVPDFFCFGKYNGNMACYFSDSLLTEADAPCPSSKIFGYAWRESTFTETLTPGKPLKITGVSLMPEAIAYLGSRFTGEPYALAAAIPELDGNQVVPGIDELLDILFNIRPGIPSARVFYESKIAEAASLLVDWWHKKHSSTSTLISPLDRSSLNTAIDYIKGHLSNRITLDDLCRVACMSPSKLASLFKATEDQTPMEYVRTLRLEQACKMLAFSDVSLGEIAIDLGFSHQGSFSEAFKAHYAISPLSYRKTHSRRYTHQAKAKAMTPTELFATRYEGGHSQ